MLTLFVVVEAKSSEIVAVDPPDVEGYYQTFGVTAHDEVQLRSLLEDYLTADLRSRLVEISERWQPDFEGADADVREQIGDTENVGIWYRSGRAWFGPEERAD